MSATTLQQHGRSIVGGLPAATHRQGTECGTLISMAEDEEEEETKEPEGLTTTEQIGIALAVLVLLIGGGAAIGGL